MILLAVLASVALLVLLVAALRVQPFLGFIVSAIVAGMLLGLPLKAIPASLEHGIGGTLGSIAVILCLGAMFGKLIADSGAAVRIADTLIDCAGPRRIPLAMAATGFLVGIPLFYNVGFVLLVPLVFSVVYRSKLPAVYLAIPMLCGLSVAHGFLPPHPSPTALVKLFGADMGRTLIFGLIVAAPTLAIAGPLFAMTLKRIEAKPPPLFRPAERSVDRPSALASFACAALPVVLLAGATLVTALPSISAPLRNVVGFVGDPMVVMLIALAVGTVVLGVARGRTLATLMAGHGEAIRDIAGILLIIGGAGALKQVFVDGGADAALGLWLGHLALSPLLLGWGLAMAIRIALGSATVAGLTAAGIVQPLVAAGGVDPSLMVLAIGAGSLMCSHVNDSGFWMFKEYFGLSLADTFRSWSAMETLVGIFGLIFTLSLSCFV